MAVVVDMVVVFGVFVGEAVNLCLVSWLMHKTCHWWMIFRRKG